jgi:endonuclease/exonuclease/phosphatase family metal-dependent hydrolase
MARLLIALALFLAAGCAARPPHEPISVEVLDGSWGSPPRDPSDKSLCIGTYNVHWLDYPRSLRRDLYRLQQDDKTRVDVWCFQEVRPRKDMGELPLTLRALLPGDWHLAIARVNRLSELGSDDWECQVIASRYPIEQAKVLMLDDDPRDKQRAALAACIPIGDTELWVVNTDHAPSFFSSNFANDRQLDRLCQQLKSFDAQQAVVAGDFNCAGNLFRFLGNDAQVRRVDQRLADAGFKSAATTGPTFHAGLIRNRLDRIYVRGAEVARTHIDTRGMGSDHYPVLCRMTLP